MREIDAAGEFWLPNEPENTFTGNLTFSQEDGGRIKTHFAKFYTDGDEQIQISSGSSKYPTIHGSLQGHGEITLINCTTHFSFGSYGDEITFLFAVLGIHIEALDTIIYN